MEIEEYFRSLTDECNTLKNRVRHFVSDAHWPTDGEWKESVLRSMLRRSAPNCVTIGRGFVVNQDACSSQIDVLIYDNSMPILYRDGDLVFITPSACRGIVEVKSNTSVSEFRSAATKLSDNAKLIRDNSIDFHIFVGFFSYDVRSTNCEPILNALGEIAEGHESRIIDHVVLGASTLLKFWWDNPSDESVRTNCKRWHLYNLHRMAPGYFIHNLLLNVSKKQAVMRERAWFPQDSKEAYIVNTLNFVSNDV